MAMSSQRADAAGEAREPIRGKADTMVDSGITQVIHIPAPSVDGSDSFANSQRREGGFHRVGHLY